MGKVIIPIVGLAVCLACIAVGLKVLKAGNPGGYVTVIGGVLLGFAWLTRLVG